MIQDEEMNGLRAQFLPQLMEGEITLDRVPEALRADREVVLAAVRQNGMALRFASAALQADREVVLAAVEQDGSALRHA